MNKDHRYRLAAFILSAALLISGCGSESSPAESESTTSETSQITTTSSETSQTSTTASETLQTTTTVSETSQTTTTAPETSQTTTTASETTQTTTTTPVTTQATTTVPETSRTTTTTSATTQTTTKAETSQTSAETAATETKRDEGGESSAGSAEQPEVKKVIALTFDDGPNTGVTNEILDIVEQYGIKVSFYVIGQNINDESKKVMQRAHSLGCEINSHSFTHSYMDKMSAEEIKDEMRRTSELIYEAVGEYPKFFRPPYIAVNTTMYEAIDIPFISGEGCNDWDDKVSVEKRVRFLTEKIRDGEIILMHDAAGNEKTVEAIRQSVPKMLEEGYTFVTTSELFAAKGITPSADREVIYSYATESGWQQ